MPQKKSTKGETEAIHLHILTFVNTTDKKQVYFMCGLTNKQTHVMAMKLYLTYHEDSINIIHY